MYEDTGSWSLKEEMIAKNQNSLVDLEWHRAVTFHLGKDFVLGEGWKLLLRMEMEVISPRQVPMFQQAAAWHDRDWLRVKEIEDLRLPKEPSPLWKLESHTKRQKEQLVRTVLK